MTMRASCQVAIASVGLLLAACGQSGSTADATADAAADAAGGDVRSPIADGIKPDGEGKRPETCGDGVVQAPEVCDDKGPSATCDVDCTKPACGDGLVNAAAGEQCDDGAKKDGDGCSASCALEVPIGCGDNRISGKEACDDGGESATCNIDCTTAKCGDGKINATAGERCDDNNTLDNDGCSSSCQPEELSKCGNKVCDPGESCASESCPADCGKCPAGKLCSAEADCGTGLICSPKAEKSFVCAKPDAKADGRPFVPLSGFSCAVAIGSPDTTVTWKDQGNGTVKLVGSSVIRTPWGDIPLSSKDLTLTLSGKKEFVSNFDKLPTPRAGMTIDATTKATLGIISGQEALKVLGGHEIVPKTHSYFQFTFGVGIKAINVSGPALAGPQKPHRYQTNAISDVTALRFLLDPCDPLFFLQVPSPLVDDALQSMVSVGMSYGGQLKLGSQLPLWDGKTSKVRAVKGHLYMQGSYKLLKIKLPVGPRISGARIFSLDPDNNGRAHPLVFNAALASGLVQALGVPANQSDYAELMIGTTRLGLPNPKGIVDVLGISTDLQLGPEGPLTPAAFYQYVSSSGVEFLFRGRVANSLFPNTSLEAWSALPLRPDIQGYLRSPTDWGLRFGLTLEFFRIPGPSVAFVGILEFVIKGKDAKLTLTGAIDLGKVKVGPLEVKLGRVAQMQFSFDFKKKQFCGDLQAVVQGAPCTLTICAGDKGFEIAKALCKASCGDTLCNGVESCYAAKPGCQKDCGKCPSGTPCTLGADCKSGHCPAGLCVQCSENSHCPGKSWCSVAGTCEKPKADGVPCTPTKGYECQSGRCPAGLCVPCAKRSDCKKPKWCAVSGTCENPRPQGTPCTKGFECQTGKCPAGICVKCATQGDCASNKWCAVDGNCYDEKPYGEPCTNSFECKSGKCPVGICVECSAQSHCASGKWCAVDGKCYGKKRNGSVCANGFECSSGKCPAGICVECSAQSHCGSNRWCAIDGKCYSRKGYGNVCVNTFECKSGRCSAGLCVDCTSQGHCGSSKWCAADGKCYGKKANGSVCVNTFECSSNVCAGLCVECVLHKDCPSNKWCGADTKCHAKSKDGTPCLTSAECSNKCCLLFCGSWC